MINAKITKLDLPEENSNQQAGSQGSGGGLFGAFSRAMNKAKQPARQPVRRRGGMLKGCGQCNRKK